MQPKNIRCPFTGTEALLCQAVGEETHDGPYSKKIVFHLLSNGVVVGILVSGRKINMKTYEDFRIGDIVVFYKNTFALFHNSHFLSYKGVSKDKPIPLEEIPYERLEYGEKLLEKRTFQPHHFTVHEYPQL